MIVYTAEHFSGLVYFSLHPFYLSKGLTEAERKHRVVFVGFGNTYHPSAFGKDRHNFNSFEEGQALNWLLEGEDD